MNKRSTALKVFSVIIMGTLIISSFTGCTSNNDNTSGDTAVARLSWYHWGEAPKKTDRVIPELNRMSAEDIGVEIDFKWTTGDDQKLKTMMATGGDFDIAFTCSWFANYVLAAQNGQLADLTEKVRTVTPRLYDYIPEIVWEGAKVNGRIYAVPTYKDTAAAQYWTANKEYVIDGAQAEKEFMAANEKASSVTPLLEKVKAYADAGHPYPNNSKAAFNYNWAGLNGYATGWDTLGMDNLRLGVKISSDEIKVLPQWEDAEMLDTFNTLKMWFDNGYVNKDALTLEKEPEFIIVGTAQGWDGAEAVWGNKKPYTVVINKKYGPIYTTAAIQGSMNGISPNSKNVDKALKYLEYANTDKDYRNMLAYGIEGENWRLTDEGNVETINDDWSPGAFSQASFFEMIPAAPAPADMYKKLKLINDSAEASPLVGFVPNTQPVKNDVTACTTIIDKYSKRLQTGDIKDVRATCQQAMKELRAAGYAKILAELQKQVDAFVAGR